jgi:hypothetical protein
VLPATPSALIAQGVTGTSFGDTAADDVRGTDHRHKCPRPNVVQRVGDGSRDEQRDDEEHHRRELSRKRTPLGLVMHGKAVGNIFHSIGHFDPFR